MSRARRQPPHRAGLLALALAAALTACTAADEPSVSSSPAPSPVAPSPAPSAPVPSTTGTPAPPPEPTSAPTATPGASPSTAPSASPPTAPAPGPATAPPTADRAPVDVVVTYGGWNATTGAVEVGAYVAGVVEVSGECVLRLSRGDRAAEARATPVADATTTGCGLLEVPGAALTSGTWAGTVDYTSPTSAGRSRSIEVEVP